MNGNALTERAIRLDRLPGTDVDKAYRAVLGKRHAVRDAAFLAFPSGGVRRRPPSVLKGGNIPVLLHDIERVAGKGAVADRVKRVVEINPLRALFPVRQVHPMRDQRAVLAFEIGQYAVLNRNSMEPALIHFHVAVIPLRNRAEIAFPLKNGDDFSA